MSRRIPILLFSLLIIAILTIPATIVVSADDGRGNNSTGGSVSGQGGGPGNGQPGNGPGAGNPASDNQTGPAPLLNGQPPSDNVTGHGPGAQGGVPPSDNISDNFTSTLLQNVAQILDIDKQTLVDAFNQALQQNNSFSDNATDNFTMHGPRLTEGVPPSDNMTDNITAQGFPPPEGGSPSDNISDNFTGHMVLNWNTSDNFTDTLLQNMAQTLNIDKQTLVDAFNQALQSNK